MQENGEHKAQSTANGHTRRETAQAKTKRKIKRKSKTERISLKVPLARATPASLTACPIFFLASRSGNLLKSFRASKQFLVRSAGNVLPHSGPACLSLSLRNGMANLSGGNFQNIRRVDSYLRPSPIRVPVLWVSTRPWFSFSASIFDEPALRLVAAPLLEIWVSNREHRGRAPKTSLHDGRAK